MAKYNIYLPIGSCKIVTKLDLVPNLACFLAIKLSETRINTYGTKFAIKKKVCTLIERETLYQLAEIYFFIFLTYLLKIYSRLKIYFLRKFLKVSQSFLFFRNV